MIFYEWTGMDEKVIPNFGRKSLENAHLTQTSYYIIEVGIMKGAWIRSEQNEPEPCPVVECVLSIFSSYYRLI